MVGLHTKQFSNAHETHDWELQAKGLLIYKIYCQLALVWLVKVKKSSPKILSADSLPTVYWQSTVSGT